MCEVEVTEAFKESMRQLGLQPRLDIISWIQSHLQRHHAKGRLLTNFNGYDFKALRWDDYFLVYQVHKLSGAVALLALTVDDPKPPKSLVELLRTALVVKHLWGEVKDFADKHGIDLDIFNRSPGYVVADSFGMGKTMSAMVWMRYVDWKVDLAMVDTPNARLTSQSADFFQRTDTARIGTDQRQYVRKHDGQGPIGEQIHKALGTQRFFTSDPPPMSNTALDKIRSALTGVRGRFERNNVESHSVDVSLGGITKRHLAIMQSSCGQPSITRIYGDRPKLWESTTLLRGWETELALAGIISSTTTATTKNKRAKFGHGSGLSRKSPRKQTCYRRQSKYFRCRETQSIEDPVTYIIPSPMDGCLDSLSSGFVRIISQLQRDGRYGGHLL